MPAWGRRQNYSAVTLTMCVIVVVTVLLKSSRTYIPKQLNELQWYSAEFLNRAKYQPVNWHTTDMADMDWDSLDLELSRLDSSDLKLLGSDLSTQDSSDLQELVEGSIVPDSFDWESLKWEDLYREPFAKARHFNRPLMVFVGGAWSLGARRFDEAVFGSREIAAMLNRDFVPVRVDISAEPEWRAALLPISRMDGASDPGFAIWFLQPTGEIIAVIQRTSWGSSDLYVSFLKTLSFVSSVRKMGWEELNGNKQNERLEETDWWSDELTDMANQLRDMRDLRDMQSIEVNKLSGSGYVSGVPDIDDFFRVVFSRRSFETWTAAKYRVLIQAGRIEAATNLLGPAVQTERGLEEGRVATDLKMSEPTKRTDLVNGGFFWLGSGSEPKSVEFGKLATDQAEMAAVLAHLWRATGDELYYYYCKRAIESVLGRAVDEDSSDDEQRELDLVGAQFLVDDGPWPSFIEVNTKPNDRSARHSFGTARLRLEFDLVLRMQAEDIGLTPRDNPQMVPYLGDLDTLVYEREFLDKFVARMQELGDERARMQNQPEDKDQRDVRPGGMDHLDSAGTTVARAIETARMLGDDRLLDLVLKRSERLERYRAGPDEVHHSISRGRHVGTDMWLGDFTAYADAMMEVYAASGDETKLLNGKLVLERALLLFGTDDETVYTSATGQRPDMGLFDLNTPSIIDDGQPPALPALVRLAFRYGAVTGDADLLRIATRVSERYSPEANKLPLQFASFIAAAQEVMITGCLLVVGEGSVEKAKQLAVKSPGRFVVPVLASDLEPGVYRAVRDMNERVGDLPQDLKIPGR